VLREALALDTGFASAWWAIAWNFLNDRMVDSARLAFSEVLKRPDRLGVPRKYRAEADADYALRYDLPAAIRAYDLYLDHFPRSYAVLNARGNYLMALGRYEEALRDFAEAVRVHPFGPKQAQMQLGNEAGTLVTLGRTREARAVARALTGPYGAYIAIMLAIASDDWRRADSIATDAADAPSSPNWLRVEAVTTTAAVLAARGAVVVADSALARASVRAAPEITRWYVQARLLLAEASGRPAPSRPDAASRDTSPPGLVTYGLWAASAGDTATASRSLRRLRVLPSERLASLGYGPDLLEASIAAGAGRWSDVVRLIGPAAIKGEHDPTLLDRVNSFSLRWLAAKAYSRVGRPDSAAAMMELLLRPTRMPGNAYALRGLTYSFAHSRLAEWYGQLGRRDAARAHWRVVLDTMQTPDTTVVHFVDEARRAYGVARSD
jgi:tetratricopeptide (TPR) repeat protein